jgi:hypothetical protein
MLPPSAGAVSDPQSMTMVVRCIQNVRRLDPEFSAVVDFTPACPVASVTKTAGNTSLTGSFVAARGGRTRLPGNPSRSAAKTVPGVGGIRRPVRERALDIGIYSVYSRLYSVYKEAAWQ